MKKEKSMIAICLSLVFMLSSVLGQIPVPVRADAADYGISSPRTDNGVTTWDCIYFGNYFQNDTNKDGTADEKDQKEPIKWRVLSKDGNDAFLMADQCLDCQSYNETDWEDDLAEDSPVTWESSTLRKWLNETFYQNAFNAEEAETIKTIGVDNAAQPDIHVGGGNNTEDKVYLLSLSEVAEVKYGFVSPVKEYEDNDERAAKATLYAQNKGYADSADRMGWWLRSLDDTNLQAWTIEEGGNKYDFAKKVFRSFGVRPVLHIDLGVSSVWESAGTVTAVHTGTSTERPEETEKPSVTKTPAPAKTPKLTEKPSTTKKPTSTKKPAATQTPAATKTPTPRITPVPRKPAPAVKMKPGEKRAISSFRDLQAMEDIPSGSYYLTKDITVPENAQLFCDYPFTGTLDGRGHKIKGYTVNKTFVIGQEAKHDLTAGGGHDLIVEEPCAGIFYAASQGRLSKTCR